MQKVSLFGAAALSLAMAGFASADTLVTSFAAYTATPTSGQWYYSDSRTGTTGSSASIVDLTGDPAGVGQPLPTGAAKLTTDNTNPSMAEVGVADNYGTVSDILSNLTLGYSYYKSANPTSPSAAPSIKLSFYNPSYSGDGFVTLIYEPYWNHAVAADTWTAESIDFTHGLFWQNGGFGQANSVGGPPLMTLQGWSGAFDSGFSAATLVEMKIGIGSYNPSDVDYFDKVSINNGAGIARTYNFEAVPAPASVYGGAALLAGLALFARTRIPVTR